MGTAGRSLQAQASTYVIHDIAQLPKVHRPENTHTDF